MNKLYEKTYEEMLKGIESCIDAEFIAEIEAREKRLRKLDLIIEKMKDKEFIFDRWY